MKWRRTIEELYRLHGSALVVFAASLAGERSAGQDAVHQVFLKLLERAPIAWDDPKAYLFRAVRNAVLDRIKICTRETELVDESWFVSPGNALDNDLSLRSALLGIAPEQREVIVLHLWGGLTFAEVASVLDINANTAMSRYRYGLANLRVLMSPERNHVANE